MRILLIAVFLAFHSVVFAFTGLVVKITDGDTIQVLHDGKPERIRLVGIDCPERGEPYSEQATQLTSDLAANQTVTIRPETTDRYGRTVAAVILPDGRDLSQELLRAGMAIWYQKYSTDTELRDIEAAAKARHLGIWNH